MLVDLTHTSHSRARTGVQRVARALLLAPGAVAICHDPYANAWRPLKNWEEANLGGDAGGSGSRGTRWPLHRRLAGMLAKSGRKPTVRLPAGGGALLVPEIFSPAVAAALPALFDSVAGPRAAIFHDAIALKLPEFAPAKTVARFPAYLDELRRFDGVAAVSEDSREALLGYWRWLGVKSHPPVEAIALGIDRAATVPAAANAPAAIPEVLCVGTIEGRKNHLALLDACERLWSSGCRFSLRLVGLPRPETAAAALEKIAALQAAGRPLQSEGSVSDRVLDDAYARCAFTVYPSLMEGFGLPVLESVARGKPCICSARGALGESARDGGCLALAGVDPASLADAIRQLLEKPDLRARLAAEASRRRLKSWAEYAREISDWARGLKRRS